MLPIFPTHLFNPQEIKADVVPAMISGGTSLSGDTTVIQTDGGGRWSVTYANISLRTPSQIRLWDMWTSFMPGQAFLVPLVSLVTAPRPIAGGVPARPSRLFTDDDAFPTVVRYAAPYIVATVVNDVNLRATQMAVNVSQGSRLKGGERFEVAGRGFKVVRVLSRSGQTALIKVFPPSRATIAAGASANFEWPAVQSKLVLGQDLTPNLSFAKYGQMSVSFVEDFSDAN